MQSTEKRRLVVASGNAHKIHEISQIFTDFDVVSQKQMGFDEDVEETGETFMENALIKARAACKALGCMVLADDSGLCVDALDGAPGVYSARYCGHHGSDEENRATLLKNMQGITDRHAHFTCALALVYPDGKEICAEGNTYGTILEKEDGEGGFGYDPLFRSDDLNKTFGRASEEEKNAVSHRFRGLQNLLTKWREEENGNK
ncbi:MAG: RdgB/HAM1 family non-canonical purine NTP pyrophosphatase [Clostridia bacterium]|nr:RdgB/HAM1 family non-canonical purine NTP pyrophosphatase [Clostridia bacterium]